MVEEEMAEEVDKKVHVEMDGCDGCSAGSCGLHNSTMWR